LRVDFYLNSDTGPDARLRLACRLVEKAYRLGHRVYVHAASHQQAQRLDDLLWTFRAGSFVPHAQGGQSSGRDHPVLIGDDTNAAQGADLLVNLSSSVPSFYSAFRRVIEVVGEEETERTTARERFRFYRDQGLSPQSHRVSGAAAP
jgi:DNA polymerase-3 subunit chi